MKSFIKTDQGQLYVRLLGYIRPYWVPFLIGLVAAIPSGGMDGLIAWLAGDCLQQIFVEGRDHFVYYVPIAVLIFAAAQGLFRFLESYCIRLVGASAIRDLRNELFLHIEKQPLQYFQGQSSGLLIGRMVNDVGIIENSISQTFQSMISRMITLLSLAAVLICQSMYLSAIALTILSLIVIPVSIFGKRFAARRRAVKKLSGSWSEYFRNLFRVLRSFNLSIWNSSKLQSSWGPTRSFSPTRCVLCGLKLCCRPFWL